MRSSQERLNKIPIILKRFRQAVLTAAYTGRLTADWRQQHSDTVQKANGQTQLGVSDKFALAEGIAIAPIPPNWAYTPIGNIAEFQQSMQIAKSTRFKEAGPKGLPILRIGNYANAFKSDVDYVEADDQTLIAEAEDLILARTGETRGKVLTGFRGVFHNNTFRLNYDKRLIVREYLMYWLQNPAVLEYIKDHSGRSAQPDLTHKAFGPCAFPLAPTKEQKVVSHRIQVLFAIAYRLYERYSQAKERVDQLEQSILAKAFCGELVPTEAELARREGRSYESAKQLLDRIKTPLAAGPMPKRLPVSTTCA